MAGYAIELNQVNMPDSDAEQNKKVLDGVKLNIGKGEFVSLLGPRVAERQLYCVSLPTPKAES